MAATFLDAVGLRHAAMRVGVRTGQPAETRPGLQPSKATACNGLEMPRAVPWPPDVGEASATRELDRQWVVALVDVAASLDGTNRASEPPPKEAAQ
ncbi:hypothetical protein L1887_58374 [Cichorium endivia]|nr:hypothetical protein L1887_58374 [Cichorium endivia]